MHNGSIQKVTAAHLKRDAFLYVRQSSLRQVMENTESTKRQYALRERAIALGWPSERIHVIDNDLGQSAIASANRDGFQQLMSKIAVGHAGIVLGLEVSRLARNNTDWHRLLELAAFSDTLILDEEGVYDPSHFNDRLLLGLKGTMSEAELHVLKARLQGGIRNKAHRGELKLPLPIGLLYQENGSIIIDPDQQIENALRLLFDYFKQTGSAMAVVKCFDREKLLFPRRIHRGIGKGDVYWGPLEHSRILQILHNPRYAGAFVYGRTRTSKNAALAVSTRKVAREDWQVLIPQAHVGYISWEEFEHNQTQLRNNANSFLTCGHGSVPREGNALLQGRVLCGVCGERMQVRYDRYRDHNVPYYICTKAAVRKGARLCQSMRGEEIDVAVSKLLQETLTPAAIEVALAVEQEIAEHIQKSEKLRNQQLERARYQTELAQRRYLKVDPDNRLVADTLEAQWNEKLRLLDQLQQEQEKQRQADQTLYTQGASEKVINIVKDFKRLWNNPNVSASDRKKILAYLIQDVTLVKNERIMIHIRFNGGKTKSLSVARPMPMSRIRKTKAEVVKTLDKLLDTCTDYEAAQELNKLGYRNWRNESFSVRKVMLVRYTYNLKSQCERLREQGYLTSAEVASRLGVSITTVNAWGRSGLLEKQLYSSGNRCLYKLPKSAIVTKGRGGRMPAQPKFITV